VIKIPFTVISFKRDRAVVLVIVLAAIVLASATAACILLALNAA